MIEIPQCTRAEQAHQDTKKSELYIWTWGWTKSYNYEMAFIDRRSAKPELTFRKGQIKDGPDNLTEWVHLQNELQSHTELVTWHTQELYSLWNQRKHEVLPLMHTLVSSSRIKICQLCGLARAQYTHPTSQATGGEILTEMMKRVKSEQPKLDINPEAEHVHWFYHIANQIRDDYLLKSQSKGNPIPKFDI